MAAASVGDPEGNVRDVARVKGTGATEAGRLLLQ